MKRIALFEDRSLLWRISLFCWYSLINYYYYYHYYYYHHYHLNIGPPYILHKDDLHRVTKTWVKFVPKGIIIIIFFIIIFIIIITIIIIISIWSLSRTFSWNVCILNGCSPRGTLFSLLSLLSLLLLSSS